MNELYSIENDIKNFSNKGEYVIQNIPLTPLTPLPINGRNHLQSNITGINLSVIDLPNEQAKPNSTVEIGIPVCDPDNVIPRLIKYYTRRILRGLVILTVLDIGLMIVTVACFVFAKQDAIEGANKVKPMVCGGIIGVISSFLLLTLCSLYATLPGGFNWMKKAKKIIKLNGTTWHCQLNSLKTVVPGDLIHPCINELYDRLRKRPNGYILVTDEGFAIDELTAYQYDAAVLVRADIINNTVEKGWIIRVFLVESGTMKNGFRKGDYMVTPVDLFMPPSMEIDEVNEVYQIILSYSRKYLLESQFLGNSRINPEV